MVRNRNAGCMKCADACTSGCISFKGGSLTVTKEKCIGCGTCATVCPTCAIEARKPSDAELIAKTVAFAQANNGVAAIACECACDTGNTVVCLGRLDESFLACLAERGIRHIVLTHGACETCEHKTGYATVQAVCETIKTLFDAWNIDFNIEFATQDHITARGQNAASAGQPGSAQ